MSDQNSTPEDPIKNLKAEMDRKLSNSEAKLSELSNTNIALMQKLEEISRSVKPQAPASSNEDLSDVFYKDPTRYAQIVEERASARAEKASQQREAAMRKTQGVLGQLQNDFPELASPDHELTRRAVEIYNGLPDDEKASSMSYKLAVQSAAVEMGVKPRSKRPVADDEPTGSSGSSSGRSSTRKREKLDSNTEELAAIFGIDTSNPEVKERLIRTSNRDWSRYQPVKKK